ncbi:hypothetical protein SLS58_005543 [Diplodia intermedia]|uniref:Uncharacterized protein n=1 Tax=Diplodia intermedia TaxID=856260 RepID=A0ABR3TQH8_9PEZI
MASSLDLGDDDWELRAEVDRRSKILFRPREQEPQLQLSRLFRTGVATASEAMSFEKNLVVQNASQLKSFKASSESAYVIRRAELNHRALSDGQEPWSIRETAVYHRYCNHDNNSHGPIVASTSSRPTSTALLVSPSKPIEGKINLVLEKSLTEEEAANPCVLHSLIVADSVKGWLGYISWLEKHMKYISTPIIYADLEPEEDDECNNGFSFNVDNRQGLKTAEDKVIDLQIILTTLRSTIEGIRKYCQKCCEMSCQKTGLGNCICASAIDEFDGYIKEVELCLERASILKERVFSTAQLLSDLLRYEDQRALKELTKQSHEFTNFFSTEFVRTDESGNMSVNPDTWLLAAFALPLTILTIITWWLCVKYIARRDCGGWALPWKRQVEPRVVAEDSEKQDVHLDRSFIPTARTWSTGTSTLRGG